tara:strand:+ start:165 stop:335 length:171 start_codon:yes stop_codon:yes gene_type:complete
MNKFYEIMTIIFAVLGILLVFASVGFIETNQLISGTLIAVSGIFTMMLSLICQEKQ